MLVRFADGSGRSTLKECEIRTEKAQLDARESARILKSIGSAQQWNARAGKPINEGRVRSSTGWLTWRLELCGRDNFVRIFVDPVVE